MKTKPKRTRTAKGPPFHLNQIELISAISRAVDKQLGKAIVPIRMMNAMIAAADIVCEEFAREERVVTSGMGLNAWLHSDQTGMSSKYMCSQLSNACSAEPAHPHDPSDFGRCLGLLNAAPELREKIGRMRDCGPVWTALVDNWSELERLYHEELPTGLAPKCYARMRELIDATEGK